MSLLTAPLRRELARVLPSRPFEIRFWDGTTVPTTSSAGPSAGPSFEVRAPSAIAHVLRSPDRLGLGRAYVEGTLDAADIDEALDVVQSWDPPAIGTGDRLRLLAAAAVASVRSGAPRRPAIELVLAGERHTRERDSAAVRYHYDVGNEFFALFLDDTMTYSCGIFSRGASTLEAAQTTKLDLVASKLKLEAGQRVLDVGCGWGSFAIRAARERGVSVLGITLSPEQAALARERVEQAGLSDRVEIRIADYRDLREPPFDAISSIGMVEHVGETRIDEYARQLASLLRPGGLLLNHGIAALDADADAGNDAFTNRYVFPDGDPLYLSRVQLAVERAGLVSEHIEGFAEDYAVTLTHWIKRLDERLDEARRLAGDQRTRVWRVYLRGARAGFETGRTAVYQVLARRPL